MESNVYEEKRSRIERVPGPVPVSLRGEQALYFSSYNFILTGDLIYDKEEEEVRFKNSALREEDGHLYFCAMSDYGGIYDGSAFEMPISLPPIPIKDIFRINVEFPLTDKKEIEMELRYKEGDHAIAYKFVFMGENSRGMAADASAAILKCCQRHYESTTKKGD